MHDARLNFVLQEFIAPEYIEAERSDYLLTENQDSGYTELTLHVKGENICIAQYDKKNRCGFWNRGQRNGNHIRRCGPSSLGGKLLGD